MAEYWKSLPRKFCDICKCWFADNRASIDFHERGKRHQENVQKRIHDIQKRGIKDFKKQKKLEDDMAKIEKAALAAYEKDLQNMQGEDKPHVDSQPVKKISDSTPDDTKSVKSSNNISQKKKAKEVVKQEESYSDAPSKLWYESVTEEGHKYYWNSETSESQWEPPEEGYVPIEEQNQVNYETTTEEQEQKVSEEKNLVAEEEKVNNVETSNSIGPQPKADPYGQWVTVEKKKPVEYDLQLPKPSEDVVEVFIPIYKDEPSVKFKEKIIGQLTDDSSEVTFKKRKFSGALRKNARQRIDDDD